MRISDWSSYVCSSDLTPGQALGDGGGGITPPRPPVVGRFEFPPGLIEPVSFFVMLNLFQHPWPALSSGAANGVSCLESSLWRSHGEVAARSADGGAMTRSRRQTGRASGREKGCK